MPTDNCRHISGKITVSSKELPANAVETTSDEGSGKTFVQYTLTFYQFEFPRLAEYLRHAKEERKRGMAGSRGKAKDFICRAAESELKRETDSEPIEPRESLLQRIETQLAEVKAMLESGVVLTQQESSVVYPENTKLSTALSALGY